MSEKDFSKDDNPFDVSGGKKSAFLPNLKDGESLKIRFMVEPDPKDKYFKVCFRHRWVKDSAGNFKGDFTCLNSRENLQKGVVCPLCERGMNPSPRFITPVMDRTDGKIKILDQGRMVYDQLLGHKRTNDSVIDIDFVYSRKGKGQMDTKYSIEPIIKTSGTMLTKEELKGLEEIDLEKVIAEKTREEILAIINPTTSAESVVEEDEGVVPF